MNAGNLKEKISYSLNALLVIAIAGLLVYQGRLNRQIADKEGQEPSAVAVTDLNTRAQTTPVIEEGREQLAAEADTLRYQLEASEEELDMAREDLADARGGPPGDISDLIAMEKKMRENPAVMNMQRRMQENMIVQNYGAFFETLGLSDDKIEDFKALLVDNELQSQEVGMSLGLQSLSEEVRKEIYQQLEDLNAELEKQARDQLGAENYEKYDAYKRRLTERFVARQVANPVGGDDSLSDEKKLALIDAMYDARKEVEAEYGIDSSDVPRMFIGISIDETKEDINRQLDIYDRYIESARGILSESQAEQFETTVKGMREMTAMVAESNL